MIIVTDEAVGEGVAVSTGGEQPMSDAAFSLSADGFCDPTVEALDKTIGLRPERFCEPVVNAFFGADAVEGMVSGGFTFGLAFHVNVYGRPRGRKHFLSVGNGRSG
jgi:hypothetical protein